MEVLGVASIGATRCLFAADDNFDAYDDRPVSPTKPFTYHDSNNGRTLSFGELPSSVRSGQAP